MKHLIFKKNEDGAYGELLASYEGPKDDSSSARSHLHSEPNASHFELPSGVEEDEASLVLVAETPAIPGTPDRWEKYEEDDRYAQPMIASVPDTSWTYVAATPPVETKWTKEGEQDVFTMPMLNGEYDSSWTVVHGSAAQDEKWTKQGEEDKYTQPMTESGVDTSWTLVPGIAMIPAVPAHYELTIDPAKVADKSVKAKEAQVTVLYNEMNVDVLTQMAYIFGTTNVDSAAATERTWTLMIQKPEKFISAGLKAQFEAGGLSIGDALNTNAKIVAYAQSKLDEVEDYGVLRMQRIEQFRNDRQSVLEA